MRYSKAFIPTTKEVPKEATSPSHVFLLRAGYVRMVGAGIYEMLPLGLRVLRKVAAILRDEMDQSGGQEVHMPAFLPADYLKESGRWDTFGDTLLRLKDRRGQEYLLGPTHEEIITDMVRRSVNSYRQLPVMLYQIQTKFRDEARPRGGLLRCREFLMKDAYSFDVSAEAAQANYDMMCETYHRIFKKLGLNYRVVQADSGAMGGSTSAEFQILTQTGEDKIVACDACAYAANMEVVDATGVEATSCPACGAALTTYRGIEGGHVFILGTHYSEKMNAHFLNEEGIKKPVVMGCYGIGVSRLMAAAIEQNHDAQGICWPMSIAPYSVILTPIGKDNALLQAAEDMYNQLLSHGVEVLLDDRKGRPGVKFKDADLLGIPLRVTIGARGLAEGVVEIKKRTEEKAERVLLENSVAHIRALITTMHS